MNDTIYIYLWLFYEQHYLDLFDLFMNNTIQISLWPFYEWHYLDLIVTFLWMILSRSNCDLFMNNTI